MVGKCIIAKWLKFVNHNPFGVVDLANYALECSNVLAGIGAIQNESALSAVVPKLTRVVWMGSELAEFTHGAWIDL